MKKIIINYIWGFLLFACNSMIAQDANSLMGIPTTPDRSAITGTIAIGNLVYDTSVNRIFEYTDVGWLELLTAGNTYVGALQITGAGTVTETNIPFRPTSVTFVAHANVEVLNISSNNGIGNNNGGIANSFGTMNGFARQNPVGITPAITEQVIYVGGSGNSINNISRFASSSNAIGIRYGNQNGGQVGLITGSVTEFTSDGFRITVTYAAGTPAAEGLVVLYTAYR